MDKDQITRLIEAGHSRAEVAAMLKISLRTLDRARQGSPPLPKGGARPGSGKPATGARPILRQAIDPNVYAWLKGQEDGFLERLLQREMESSLRTQE